MAKKDISKILLKGTPIKKLLLIAEDIARGKYMLDKILTDKEFNQISNSFKTNEDIRLWNNFKLIDATVSNAIMNLNGALFEVKMNYSNLRGYILLWNSVENTELLANSILNEIKDPKERKRIAENGAKGIDLLFTKTETDKEGFLDIKVDFEKESYLDKSGNLIKGKPIKTNTYSLLNIMNNVKREATTSATKWLSWEKALTDYINNNGFKVKTYQDKITEMKEEVFSSIIAWRKYYGEMNIGTEINPTLKELIKNYSICPNVEDIEIDETEYNWFKNIILGDE